MAPVEARNDFTAVCAENNIVVEDVIECKCCWYLKRELLELREELSSAKLIIQLLQMENGTYDTDSNLNTDYVWKTVESNRADNINADRKSEEEYGTSKDFMLTTTNRFSILSDLDKADNWSQIEDGLHGHPRRRLRKPSRTKVIPQFEHRVDLKSSNHSYSKFGAVSENPEDLIHQIPVVVNGLTSPTVDVLKNRRATIIHRIRIIGDSHARDAAGNVKQNLDATFSTSGIVCPGIKVGNMIPLMTPKIKQLNHKDVMILWGGANDVYKNNSCDALKQLTDFMGKNKHTNIIILCIPHRHDLPEWSCVNKGIQAFNRALMKLMKPYKHVTVVQVDPTRIYYTRHGQHMNNLGKERIALSLVNVITDMFNIQDKTDSDTTSIKVNPVAPPVDPMTVTLEEKIEIEIDVETQNDQPDSHSDIDKDCDKVDDDNYLGQTQTQVTQEKKIEIDVETQNDQPDSHSDIDKDCDKIDDDNSLGQTQTQDTIHTTDCGSVGTLIELIQNTLNSDEDKITHSKQKQEVADDTNCDGDSGEKSESESDGVDDSDGDSDTIKDSDSVSEGDSDNDTKPLVLMQDTSTTDATDGIIPLTEIHDDTVETGLVDSDKPIEICRISTRNKKAPRFKSNDFLW